MAAKNYPPHSLSAETPTHNVVSTGGQKHQKHWFVMRDLKRPNAKLPAYKMLEDKCFEVFIPTKWQVVTKLGKRVREKVPVINGLLFVHSERTLLDPIVELNSTLQYYYRKGGHGEYLRYSKYKMGNLHADVMFNVLNLFGGYNENRKWDLSPYAGLGWARVYDSPSAKEVSANIGVLTSWHFCKSLALNLDVRGMFVNDRFDGEDGGRSGEGNLSATLGLSYKFKQRGWDRSKTVYRYDYGDLESMRQKLNDMSAENERLKRAIADGDRQRAQTHARKIAAANLVTFKINKTSLSNEARVNLGMMAEIIKSGDPDAVYVVTGYADAGTGSKKGNERLSKERAESVYNCLVKEFGVSEKQLRIDYKGGVDNMFYNDPRLSRAVITKAE